METPHDSVDDRVKSLVDVSEEVAVITTMMNDRVGPWEVTEDRLVILKKYKKKLGPSHRSVVDEMLEAHLRGERFWETRAERQAALLHLSLLCQAPTKQDIERVLVTVRVGAAHDSVLDRPWVKDVLMLLDKMLVHDPDRPSALEGLDDKQEGSSFHLSPL